MAMDPTMAKYTGEKDDDLLPVTNNILPWKFFNTNMESTQRTYEEVASICDEYPNKLVDLRPYMIEEPWTINMTDKLPKVLDLFRHFHIRALPVIDPNTGLPVAVITRQDLFSYMHL